MRVEKLSNVAMANFQLPKPDIDLHPHTWFAIRSILRLCHRSSFGRYWALPLKLLPPRTECSTDTRSLYVWCLTDGSRLSSMTNKINVTQSYSSAPFCYLHHNIQPLYKPFILYKWKTERKEKSPCFYMFSRHPPPQASDADTNIRNTRRRCITTALACIYFPHSLTLERTTERWSKSVPKAKSPEIHKKNKEEKMSI